MYDKITCDNMGERIRFIISHGWNWTQKTAEEEPDIYVELDEEAVEELLEELEYKLKKIRKYKRSYY